MKQNISGQQVLFAQNGESKIDIFKKKEVRKIFNEGEWWFSVKDVLEVLVETPDGSRYSRDLRDRDDSLKARWAEITRTIPFKAGMTTQNTTFINIEGIFRLMQSVPSGKAEDFKKWLAKVGFERIQEIQNPEIAVKRAMTFYKAKGYGDDWIEARIQNKISREKLENEWNKRGIEVGFQYAILTDAISIETFGITTKAHKEYKSLGKLQGLRDNMTPIELTLTTLGEQATTEIAKTRNAKGMIENLDAAKRGGSIAKVARLQLEDATKKSVVSRENYLTDRQKNNQQLPSEFDKTIKGLLNQGPSEKR